MPVLSPGQRECTARENNDKQSINTAELERRHSAFYPPRRTQTSVSWWCLKPESSRWQRKDNRHPHHRGSNTDTQNTETMDLRHKTHVSTSWRVAPPVQGATPRLNMAIVQFNTGDENLQGGGGEQWGGERALIILVSCFWLERPIPIIRPDGLLVVLWGFCFVQGRLKDFRNDDAVVMLRFPRLPILKCVKRIYTERSINMQCHFAHQ